MGKLDIFADNTEVTPEVMLEAGLIKSLKQPIKILGDGDISHSLTIKASKFSATAENKIVAAGGRVEKV